MVIFLISWQIKEKTMLRNFFHFVAFRLNKFILIIFLLRKLGENFPHFFVVLQRVQYTIQAHIFLALGTAVWDLSHHAIIEVLAGSTIKGEGSFLKFSFTEMFLFIFSLAQKLLVIFGWRFIDDPLSTAFCQWPHKWTLKFMKEVIKYGGGLNLWWFILINF